MAADTLTFGAKRAVLVMLRLACVLSLWHAPIPWVHIHSTDDAELANHIHHFHPELREAAHDGPEGWHWHTVLPPWGRNPSSTSEEDEPTPWTVVEFDPAVVVAALSWHVDVDHAVWNPVHQPMISSPWTHSACSADEFLGTYLQSRSAQQILSVCLC